MSQKRDFLEGEGDAWFERNSRRADFSTDPVVCAIERLNLKPKQILEIGCGPGFRLTYLRERLGADCYGIDPSAKAVEFGRGADPALHLRQGTADELKYESQSFDMVIFGFCLYLCDPTDYFRIAQNADRVLRESGHLVILDFESPVPYRAPYSHRTNVFSYKMEWAPMFTWHPAYRLISRGYAEHCEPYTFHPHERITIDILRKDFRIAFISNPYPQERK